MTPCEIRGTGETDDGSRSEVRFSELRTPDRAFLDCYVLHAPQVRLPREFFVVEPVVSRGEAPP